MEKEICIWAEEWTCTHEEFGGECDGEFPECKNFETESNIPETITIDKGSFLSYLNKQASDARREHQDALTLVWNTGFKRKMLLVSYGQI